MAVVYRSTNQFNSSSSTTAVVPAPAGLTNGDLVFVIIRRAAAINPTSVPAGWTLIRSTLAKYGFWLYYKIANNEGASWTWTWAAASKTLGRSHAFYGDIDIVNPIQSSTTPYSDTANGTIITIPSLTTTSDNTVSFLFASGYSTSAKTFAVPTSPAYIEHNDSGSTTPDFWQAIASYNYTNSGSATGTTSYSASANSTYRIGCRVLVNTIPPNLPPSIIPNYPSDGSTTSNTTPIFNFTGSDPESDAVEYNIQIDTANTFDSQSGNPIISAFSAANAGFSLGHPFASGSAVEYTSQIMLASGTYYWRVSAIDPSGSNTYSDWSSISSLTIVSNYAPSVVLNLPNDQSIGMSTTPVLYFTGTDPENNRIEYEVQIDTVNTFDSILGSSGIIASDSFESLNWTSVLVSGSNAAWTRVTSSSNPTGISPQNNGNMARFNAYTCQANAQARFYSNVPFNIQSDASICSLNFWVYHETGYSTNNDRIQAQISTNGGVDWINVGSPISRYDGTTGWAQVSIDISAYIGIDNLLIAFLGISGYGNDCYIDNINISYSLPNAPILDKKSDLDTGFMSGHPFISGSQVSFSVQSADSLADSMQYHWRVRAIDPIGGGAYGDWTGARSFFVGNLPPTVSLDNPVEGQLVSTFPAFSFVGIDTENDLIEYNIQIDTVNTFDSQLGNPLISKFSISDTGFSLGHPYASGDAITYTVQSSLALGTYYWRVAGIDTLGKNVYGVWSQPQSFVVVNNAPPFVQLNYPANGGQGVPPNATFMFTGTDPENDSIEYHIQVDTTDRFNSNGGGSPVTGYSNGFESTNWTSLQISGSGASWVRANSSTHPTGVSAQNGTYFASFNSYTCSAGSTARFYASDTITITSGAGSARLSFWMYHDTAYPTSNDRVQLQISRNGGSSWVNVGSAVARYNGNTGWERATIDIASYIGVNNIMISFLGISGYGNDCHIDNASIEYDLPFINRRSLIDLGFMSGHPYSSGSAVSYSIQPSEILTKGTNYYWRARAIDPLGINIYGPWSSINCFVPNTGVKVSDGSSWTYKPIKVWNGSIWQEKPVKVWDGTTWVVKG